MSSYRLISAKACLRTAGVVAALSTAPVAEKNNDPSTTSAVDHKKTVLLGPKQLAAISAQREYREQEIKHKTVNFGVINNPGVSLGLFLTLCALVGMMYKSYSGDRLGAQRFMRYRIIAQFFTLFALIVGVSYFSIKLRKDEEKRITAEKATSASVTH